MGTVLEVFIAWSLVQIIYVAAMAITARSLGIELRTVALGSGPRLLSHGIFEIRLLWWGGHVAMKDTQRDDTKWTDAAGAYNFMPTWVQVAPALAGPLSLVVLDAAIEGTDALQTFVAGFAQFVQGAISPLGVAQELLRSYHSHLDAHTFLPGMALLGAKIAAVNLMPVPPFNGGLILLRLLQRGPVTPTWQTQAMQWGLVLLLASWISWIVAIVVYANRWLI